MSGRMLVKGDRLVAYGASRPRSHLFIEVTRVAKDGKWADMKVCNCFVMWTKRQQLDARGLPPAALLQHWDQRDLNEQCARWDEEPS